MSGSRWLVTAVATALGVALASPALAADLKSSKDPAAIKALVKVKPKVKQIEVPGFPARNSSSIVLNLVKGQSYTVKVTYSTPILYRGAKAAPSAIPSVGVASKGLVVAVGGAYQGAVYQFYEKYCLRIPPVKPGDSTVLETPVFQVPANLTGNQFSITAYDPASSQSAECR